MEASLSQERGLTRDGRAARWRVLRTGTRHVSGGLCVVLLLVLTFLLGCFLNKDMDIWWHLKAGEQILAGDGIPRIDHNGFETEGREWVDLHWGYQVLVAWLYRHGGFEWLTLASAAIAALSVGVGLVATDAWRWPALVSVCWIPAVLVASSRFYVRPEMVTLLCLTLYLAILPHAQRRPRLVWLLVPVQLLWVNTQGLFVLGLVLLGCWWAELLVRRSGATMRQMAAPTLCVLLACLINPYGWQGAMFPLTLLRKLSVEQAFYVEHASELMSIPQYLIRFGFRGLHVVLGLVLAIVTGASFLLGSVRVFRLLAFLAFTWLGLLALRNQPQFALVSGAVLSWNASEWLASRPPLVAWMRHGGRLAAVALLAVLTWSVGSGAYFGHAHVGRLAGLGEHPLWHAHEAARVAAEPGMPRHVIAFHTGQAAVFLYHKREDQKVYVDPRLEVVSRQVMQQYAGLQDALRRGGTSWKQHLAGLPRPLTFLVDHRSHGDVEAALLAEAEWRCLWFDALAGVYVPAEAVSRSGRPGIDFAARCFAERPETAQSPEAQRLKSEALLSIGMKLLQHAGDKVDAARPLLLLALQQAQRAGVDEVVALSTHYLHPAPPVEVAPGKWALLETLAAARTRTFLRRAVRTDATSRAALHELNVAHQLGDTEVVRQHLAILARTARSFEQRQLVARIAASLRPAKDDGEEPISKHHSSAADLATLADDLIEGRRFQRALTVMRAHLKQQAKAIQDPAVADRYAFLLLLGGQPAEARAVWEAMPVASGEPETQEEKLALSYLVECRYEQAIQWYRRALQKQPQGCDAWWGLAICYFERGDATAAVSACDAALRFPEASAALRRHCQRLREIAVEHAAPEARATGADGS